MATKKKAEKKVEPAPAPEKAAAKPVAKKAPSVSKKAAAKKAVAKKTVTPAKKPAGKKVSTPKPSLDMIARAAYLNYRRRVEQGLPGDSQTDWLEAERQMI